MIHLVDFEKCTGKTTYCKFLCLNNSGKIGRIKYSTSHQLRSLILKLGEKQLYLMELLKIKN